MGVVMWPFKKKKEIDPVLAIITYLKQELIRDITAFGDTRKHLATGVYWNNNGSYNKEGKGILHTGYEPYEGKLAYLSKLYYKKKEQEKAVKLLNHILDVEEKQHEARTTRSSSPYLIGSPVSSDELLVLPDRTQDWPVRITGG